MNPIQAISRNERQQQLNTKLSVLPAFSPLNDYQVYHINRATSAMLLPDLIQCASRTTRFSIDTEHDYYTHQAALIQIEFIQDKSVVVLIETCHLPHASSVLFWLIRSLLKVVFKSSNTIYAWGNAIHQLSDFVQYGVFSSQTLYQMNAIDVQHDFKKWYNKTFFHHCGVLPPFYDNNALCTCRHRSVRNPNNQWSLQNAIAYTFDQFLDKSRTKSRWCRPLDIAYVQERFGLNDKQKRNLEYIIRYAVNDCLAVTKILVFLEDNM